MPDLHSAKLIAVIALVTIALRFLPFVIFSGKRQTPAYISYLGKVLPFSIMGMLVIYCLRNISFSAASNSPSKATPEYRQQSSPPWRAAPDPAA